MGSAELWMFLWNDFNWDEDGYVNEDIKGDVKYRSCFRGDVLVVWAFSPVCILVRVWSCIPVRACVCSPVQATHPTCPGAMLPAFPGATLPACSKATCPAHGRVLSPGLLLIAAPHCMPVVAPNPEPEVMSRQSQKQFQFTNRYPHWFLQPNLWVCNGARCRCLLKFQEEIIAGFPRWMIVRHGVKLTVWITSWPVCLGCCVWSSARAYRSGASWQDVFGPGGAPEKRRWRGRTVTPKA